MKINLETLKKNKITQTVNKELFMVKLTDNGQAKKESDVQRKPLNVAYVVDASVSMDDQIITPEWKAYKEKIVKRQQDVAEYYKEHNGRKQHMTPQYGEMGVFINNNIDFPIRNDIYWDRRIVELPEYLKEPIPMPAMVTKLMQAKKALKEAVNAMVEGDIVSIVLFANEAQVIVEPTKVNNDNKKMLMDKINGIHTLGATNLYAGWHLGALQVAKNFSQEKINRVELLTDGEITAGENKIEVICKNVSLLLEAGIGVSTFGFGDKFNEVLLEGISVSGNGNFYYVTESTNLSEIFMVEFDDIKNTAAQQIELSFETVAGLFVKNITSTVLKEKSPGKYIIPNVRFNTSREILFELNFDWNKISSVSELDNAITVNVKYLNNKGETVSVSKGFNMQIVDETSYNNAIENSEIKIQKALIDVAENQRKAMEEMQKGNLDGATMIMENSLNFAREFSDSRLVGASQTLSASLNSMSDAGSHESIKKELYFSSYKGFRGE